MRTDLRPITILTAAALLLTGCAGASGGGPETTDGTGSATTSAGAGITSESTAAETLDAYFAAIDAGDAATLDTLLLEPVGAETIAIPASAPTGVSYQGGDEVNPSAPTKVPMTVEVSYQVGETPVTWEAELYYATPDGGEPRWYIGNGLQQVAVPEGFTGDVSGVDVSKGQDGAVSVNAAPGVHEVGVEPSNPLLKAPAEPVEFTVEEGGSTSSTAAPTATSSGTPSLVEALESAEFQLADSADATILEAFNELAANCDDWCTENALSHEFESIEWTTPTGLAWPIETPLVRIPADGKKPTEVELITAHNETWSDWFTGNSMYAEGDQPVFVAVSPVSVVSAKSDCWTDGSGPQKCDDARTFTEETPKSDAVVVFDISTGTPIPYSTEKRV